MIYTTKLKTDSKSREILPGNFEESLFVCMKRSLDRYAHRLIPWHWHDSFEIDYVLQGEMDFRTTDSSAVMKQGDIFFINQGALHRFQGHEDSPCVVYSILFDMHFLSGIYNSQIERKYILPIKESGIDYYVFSPDSPERLAMVQSILNAIEILKADPPGWEMLVRSELSDFWIQLLGETKDLRQNTEKTDVKDKDRIKKMLEFIHTSYADKIAVEDIASVADVSERECSRCFDRCIGKSPMKYLTDYRIHAAAEMLRETDLSVLDISEACGFSSSSYFGKCFSELMGCTPKEYRSTNGIDKDAI